MELISKKKGKHTKSNSTETKWSESGSNQYEPLSTEFPGSIDHTTVNIKAKPNAKQNAKNSAMGTRSKKMDLASPAMSTRSKRRLSL
ncbi:hypothetical protein PVAP13_2KG280100 [Panicum virgatum]|uniref:Uncharacterized protein n=1 Tax=Panicum virgatum TaxID=38727 RepID=A0A8T0W4L8_PANVG|nr:hypothetical protein PVAP13_2KG280100 [Panicum virgatum]